MELFLRVLNSKAATVHEEALMAIGSIASKCGPGFDKYIPIFKPFLLLGLQNAAEHHVCIVSVGVVSEICAALGKKTAPYCDEIMQALLHNLQNPHMERSVKPHIISCLADVAIKVALNVDGYFERYLPYVMMMLVQASAIKFDNMDEDSLLYLISLQEAILEAYTGILQGLAADNKVHLFLQFVESVVGFLDSIASSASKNPDDYDSVVKGGVGVAGDLASRLGSKVKQHLHRPAIHTLLALAMRSENKDTLKAAAWTKDQLAKL
jgi:importin subunit beta-1